MPIWQHPLGHSVSTGVTYGVQLPGLVPLYEELGAATRRGLTESAWLALSPDERALAVARDRLEQMAQTHAQDAVLDAQEAARRNARHGKDW